MRKDVTPTSPDHLATGIAGFDALTGGGLPRGRTTLVLGSPGAGKTLFALQFLANGARETHESGLFVTFEERLRDVEANIAAFSWAPRGAVKRRLQFVEGRPLRAETATGEFDLLGLVAAVQALARRHKVRRVALDGLDALLAGLGDDAVARREMFRLSDWLTDAGLATLVTLGTEAGEGKVPPRYAFLEYMADCVVVLEHRLVDRIGARTLRVPKFRGSAHFSGEVPVLLTPRGFEVGFVPAGQLGTLVSKQRVSSGVDQLDEMLGGGYYRGTCILVSGAPGTAKSTLAAGFLDAACKRGERALYVSFDEPAQQIVRNMSSVGIGLRAHVDTGRLAMHSVAVRAANVEHHVLMIRTLMREHSARSLVIDPISAFGNVGGPILAHEAIVRLLQELKVEGVSVLLTSLLETTDATEESTATGISTIADTWIHLTYVIQRGERNRALSIVKSRGMAHSNQTRELVLSPRGVGLTDVFVAGGEVLMGTLRWEKEREVANDRAQTREESERAERRAVAAAARARARLESERVAVSNHEAELTRIRAQRQAEEAEEADRENAVRGLRRGDATRRVGRKRG